jgi:trehalose 6-phosphate synthase
MRRTLRFLFALLAGLGLLTAAGHFALTRTTQAWFEADVELRASLAVASAKGSLARNWKGSLQRVEEILADITRDKRIMGAAACSLEGAPIVSTEAYPTEFSCRVVLDRWQKEAPRGATSWSMLSDLSAGRVHVSAVTIEDERGPLGVVLLVHDLSFIARREQTTRNLLLVAFFVLSLGGSAVAVLAAKVARREWTLGLQRALSGEPEDDFQPLVRDVRSLVERLASERGR